MFTARTALAIGKFYQQAFTYPLAHAPFKIASTEAFYEFFVARNYDAEFCDAARRCVTDMSIRDVFISIQRWAEDARYPQNTRSIQQSRLKQAAEHVLSASPDDFGPGCNRPHYRERQALIACLELDGYAFGDGRILRSEGERAQIHQERGELESMYAALGLGNAVTVTHHLRLCEEYYAAGDKAGDSIHNARQYLEQILEDVAVAWSGRSGCSPLPKTADKLRAVHVREYLYSEGLLSKSERDAFAQFYGLLSATGGHPGMSEQNQARVFRRLALSMALYVLLSFEARLKLSSVA